MKRPSGWTVRFRLFDVIAIVIALAVVLVMGVRVYSDRGSGNSVHIHGDGDDWYYPRNVERTVEVEGPIGTTRVEISQGRARVVDSPCRDKICISRGALSEAGDWTACLPNGVIVEVSGSPDGEVDAITY